MKMLQLYFNPAKFPRTIKRDEWKEIWRWKRITENKLIEATETQLQNLVIFGSTMPRYVRDDIMDKTINPPLLVHDKQEL